MSDSIGDLHAKITADASGFSAGLTKGRTELQGFAKDFAGIASNLMPGGLGSAFSLGAGMATGATAIGAIKAAATGAWSSMMELGKEAKATVREAERLGMSVHAFEQFGESARKAGLDVGTIEHAMLKLQGKLGEALLKGGEAEGPFKALNFDPKKLAGMDPEAQFKAIAAAIMSIHDRAVRTRMEMDLFGKSGAELEGAFKRIASGKQELTMSEEATRNLARFAKGWGEISQIVKTLGNEFIGLVSGPLATMAESLLSIFHSWDDINGAAQKHTKHLEDQAELARKIADTDQQAMAKRLEQSSVHLGGQIARPPDVSKMEELLASDSFSARWKRNADEIAQAKWKTEHPDKNASDTERKADLDHMNALITKRGELNAEFIKSRVAAKQAADAMLEGMQNSLMGTPSWMVTLKKTMDDMRKAGMGEGDIQRTRDLGMSRGFAQDAKAEGLKAQSEIESMMKGTLSAEEKFVAETKKIHDWAAKGMIGPGQEEALIGRSRKELLSAWKSETPAMASGAEHGSAEEYQSIVAAQNQQATLQQQQLRLQQLEADAAREAVGVLQDIRDGNANRPVIGANG